MTHDWGQLTSLTAGKEFVVTRIRLQDSGIAVEGEFGLSPLAKLSYEDQVFVAMFVKSHGSIKDMEQAFGVSYPTIKARLNRIGEQLGFVEVKQVSPRESILDMLERGEITAQEAAERLGK